MNAGRLTPEQEQEEAAWRVRLDKLPHFADLAADQLVAELVARVADGDAERLADRPGLLPDLLAAIARDIKDDALDGDVREFLLAGTEINPTIDEHLEDIKRAQSYFDENGVAIITALFHASLPEAYLGQRGVQVLDATGELFLNWTRRVQETGQFLVNVLTPTPDLWQRGRTSLSAGEFGARAARRVRLTHAAIRWMLGVEPEPELPSLLLEGVGDLTAWKARLVSCGLESDVGVPPLNQQDLLATLGTFTTIVFRALERLGVPYEQADRAAFHVLWSVVAWHMGIGDAATLASSPHGPVESVDGAWPGNALLPIDADKMDRTYDYLAKILQAPSDAGRRMAKTLMQELAYPLPGPLERAPALIARYLIGPDKADQLDIEKGGYAELLVAHSGVLRHLTTWARTAPTGRLAVGTLAARVTAYAVRAFVAQARWSARGLTIEPRVAAKWGIDLPPDPRTAART